MCDEHEFVGTHLTTSVMGSHTHTHTESNMYNKCEYAVFYIKSFNQKVHRKIDRDKAHVTECYKMVNLGEGYYQVH